MAPGDARPGLEGGFQPLRSELHYRYIRESATAYIRYRAELLLCPYPDY